MPPLGLDLHYCDCKILSTSTLSNTGVKLPGASLLTATFCVCSSPFGPATTTVYSPGATGTRTGVSWFTLMVAWGEVTVLTVPQGTALISMYAEVPAAPPAGGFLKIAKYPPTKAATAS